MQLIERITLDPDVCHGKPCIRHMRWPVEVILDMLTAGMSIKDIVSEHPELEQEDVIAALSFAKSTLIGQVLQARVS